MDICVFEVRKKTITVSNPEEQSSLGFLQGEVTDEVRVLQLSQQRKIFEAGRKEGVTQCSGGSLRQAAIVKIGCKGLRRESFGQLLRMRNKVSGGIVRRSRDLIFLRDIFSTLLSHLH